MAKPNPRSGRGQPARAAAKSRKPAASDVDVADDKPGMGVDVGLAVMTGVLLIAALVLVDKMQGILDKGFIF